MKIKHLPEDVKGVLREHGGLQQADKRRDSGTSAEKTCQRFEASEGTNSQGRSVAAALQSQHAGVCLVMAPEKA